MMSLDVKVLFDNVPLNTILDFIERNTNANAIAGPTTAQHFTKMTESCTQKLNFCR